MSKSHKHTVRMELTAEEYIQLMQRISASGMSKQQYVKTTLESNTEGFTTYSQRIEPLIPILYMEAEHISNSNAKIYLKGFGARLWQLLK